jgi:glycosyltransferase involved in cell wall biosynthesis
VIEHDKSGVLVAPGDARALADAVRAIAQDPSRARALGDAARVRVRERFTWDAVAARFEALYEESCARGAP